jgi:hypothetical protein
LFFFFLLRHQNPDVSGQNASSDPINRNQGAFQRTNQPQKNFSLPLYTFCLLAIPISHGKTYKAAQTLA